MILNPVVLGSSTKPNLASCEINNETKFASQEFFFMNEGFEVNSVQVTGYETRNIQVPIGTLFVYDSFASVTSTDFSGNVEQLEAGSGIYKVLGDFQIRIWQ